MPDPLDAARARGRLYRDALLHGPEMMAEQEVIELLGLLPADLESMRINRQVLALPDDGAFKYPAWQFDLTRHNVLPGLAEVLAILKNPWTAFYWLQKAEPFLADRPPILTLKSGQISAVIKAAELYGGDQGGT